MAEQQARVSERIKKIREDHSLTQEQAASRAEVTLRQWQRWESGESTPYKSSLEKVARAFRVPPAEFYDEVDDLPPGRMDDVERKLAALTDLVLDLGKKVDDVFGDDGFAAQLREERAAREADVASLQAQVAQLAEAVRLGAGLPSREEGTGGDATDVTLRGADFKRELDAATVRLREGREGGTREHTS